MYHPFASMIACTRDGIDLHKALNCFGGNFSQQRGRTSASFTFTFQGPPG